LPPIEITAVLLLFVLIVLLAAIISSSRRGGSRKKREIRAAGDRGEKIAAKIIRSALRPGDVLLRNVGISHGGSRTEIDNIVINRRGVFIIEVKNYSGRLYGSETDFEWDERHVSRTGVVYPAKKVKNPIVQVRRQIHLLAATLKSGGIRVWVSGYAYLVERNSPIKSEYLLNSASEIDRAIHPHTKERLTREQIDDICFMLTQL